MRNFLYHLSLLFIGLRITGHSDLGPWWIVFPLVMAMVLEWLGED